MFTSGSNMLGSMDFSLSCTVTVSVSVTSLNVTLLDSTNTVRNSTLFTSLSAGSSSTVIVSFGTLSTSDAGQYSCIASAVDNDGSATVSVMGYLAGNTDFTSSGCSYKCPLPMFHTVRTPPLAGMRRFLICSLNIPHVSVRFIWQKNGEALPNDSRVISTSSGKNSTLEFNPLRTSDGAQYQCVAEVTLLGTGIMLNLSAMINYNVTSEWINTHTHTNTIPLFYSMYPSILQYPSSTSL